MNDSLIPYQGGHYSETAEESVSRQFYEWEERGRGWLLCNFPVEIEPPFRPFYLFDFQQDIPAIDDGRHESFFNRLFGNSNQNQQAKNALESQRQLAAYREQIAELDEPLVCDYHDQEFEEIQLVLPKELKITKSVSEQFLLSLSYCSHPVSFEIIGTSREIIVQMAATGRDLFQLKQQLKAHVPQVILNESTYSLLDNWRDNGSCEVVVDFGLSREFMLPLNSVNNLETDPLVAIVGALSSLS